MHLGLISGVRVQVWVDGLGMTIKLMGSEGYWERQ